MILSLLEVRHYHVTTYICVQPTCVHSSRYGATYLCVHNTMYTCTYIHMLYVVQCSTHKAGERSHLHSLLGLELLSFQVHGFWVPKSPLNDKPFVVSIDGGCLSGCEVLVHPFSLSGVMLSPAIPVCVRC